MGLRKTARAGIREPGLVIAEPSCLREHWVSEAVGKGSVETTSSVRSPSGVPSPVDIPDIAMMEMTWRIKVYLTP